MCAAGVEAADDERSTLCQSAAAVVDEGAIGSSLAAVGGIEHGHAFAVDGVATDSGADGDVRACGAPGGDGEVEFVDVAFGECFGKGMVGGILQGDDHEPAGFFVEAVDDAGARHATHRGERAEAVKQGVDQRAGRVAGGGVDDHARWLVDHSKGLIFVNDLEGNVLGGGLCRSIGRDFDSDVVAGADGVAGFRLGSVDGDVPFLDQRAQAGSRQGLEAGGEAGVEASGRRGVGRDGNLVDGGCLGHSWAGR